MKDSQKRKKKESNTPRPAAGGGGGIPWKDSLSGEVGGYPQALPEVVTLMEC